MQARRLWKQSGECGRQTSSQCGQKELHRELHEECLERSSGVQPGDGPCIGRAQTGRSRADIALSPDILGSLRCQKPTSWSPIAQFSDPQKLAAYAELALPAVKPFGARILVRGNAAVAREHGLKERTVVTEFPSLEKASAAYDSAGYAEALKALGDGAVRDFRIVEGVE